MSGAADPWDAVLADVGAAHRSWIELIGSVPSVQVSERPLGGWSLVDGLVHVASWKENASRVARLQAARDAPRIGPDDGVSVALGIDVDEFNDGFMAAHRDWSLDRAVAYAQRVHDELMEALLGLPSDRLFDGPWPHGARRWYWRPAVVHPAEHRQQFETPRAEG
jgi:hypothetical protein